MRFLMLCCLGTLVVTPNSRAQNGFTPTLKTGDKAPTFFLRTLDGEKFFLRDYAGEPRDFSNAPRRHVLLSFFASWCGPCKKEIPELEAILPKYLSESFKAFLVNVGDNEEVIKKLIEEGGYRTPVISDQHGVVAKKYCPKEGDLVTLPTVVIIDKEGTIAFVKSGYQDGDVAVLEEQLKKLLGTP